MIKISNLSKTFLFNDEKISIFENLNINFSSWLIHTIMWPSWSGKTTLLNIMAWLDNFDTWDLIINNINLKNFSENKKTSFRWQNISFIFQDFQLISNLTVLENVELVLDINKLERRFEPAEIIELVWLKWKEGQYPYNLSWWEKQRVAIARAFVWKTPLLLADEPTGNLDFHNTQKIINLIKDLHKKSGNTIIIITHDKEITKKSEKNYQIENKQIVEFV